MDEIILDEKKYISSKRAADITGYAKDYVGQLCREGRIPARLVGRNWFVLEAAIQDHRFGTPEEPVEASKRPPEEANISSTWETARYKAEEIGAPYINQLSQENAQKEAEGGGELKEEVVTPMQNAWQDWFSEAQSVPAQSEIPEEEPSPEGPIEEPLPEVEPVEEDVVVPIRAVYHPSLPVDMPNLSRERTPELASRDEQEEEATTTIVEERVYTPIRGKTVAIIRTIGILIAIGSAALAIFGSGYVDTYAISFKPLSQISGVSLYNK